MGNSQMKKTSQSRSKSKFNDAYDLISEIQDKSSALDELNSKLKTFNEYVGQVDLLKSQISAMEQLLKDKSQQPSVASSQEVSQVHGKRKLKMNVIDNEDTMIDKLQQSIDSKERALKSKAPTKSSLTIMNEMQSSIKKIESKITEESQETIQKLKLRIRQLSDDKKKMNDLINQLNKDIERQNQRIIEYEQKIDEVQDLNSNLSDELQSLNKKNKELLKLNNKYKKEVELIPELKSQLTTMKETLYVVENEIEQERQSQLRAQEYQMALQQEFNSQVSRQQDHLGSLTGYQKQIEEQERKNYDLIKENIDLKDTITQLKSDIIQINNNNEQIVNESKMMTSDLIYIYNKMKNFLGRGDSQQFNNNIVVENQFLLKEIEQLSEDLVINAKELEINIKVLEERLQGTKEQNTCLQKIIDKNQEVMIDQQNKIQMHENQIRDYQKYLEQSNENDKQLDRFRLQIHNQLLNMKHQIDNITQSINPNNKEQKQMSIEQLLDMISQKLQESLLSEKNLKQKVKDQHMEIERINNDFFNKLQTFETKRQQIDKEEQDKQTKFYEKLKEQQEQLEKCQYEYSYYKIDNDAKLRGKEIQITDIQEQNGLLQEFLAQAFNKIQSLSFQKHYLKQQELKQNDLMNQTVSGIKNLMPPSQYVKNNNQPLKPITLLKRTVLYLTFISRLKKRIRDQSYYQISFSKVSKNIVKNQCEWNDKIIQNEQSFKHLQEIFKRLQSQSISSSSNSLMSLSMSRYSNPKQLDFIEHLRQYMNSLQNSMAKLEVNIKDKDNQLILQKQKIQLYEEETQRQYESNERLSNQLNKIQSYENNSQQEQNQKMSRVVKELQEKLDEQEIVYLQKIKYLKRDIELKTHQLESMKSLMEFKDKESQRQITERSKEEERIKISSRSFKQQCADQDTGVQQKKQNNNFYYSFSENI